MNWLVRFATSSVGAKAVMAGTGAGMVAFVVFHMIGNLQIFLDPDAINAYGDFLKNHAIVGKLLWAARAGLIAMLVLHIAAAIRVRGMSAEARTVQYQAPPIRKNSTIASRTMFWGGICLFAFILFHIAHFTLGWIEPEAFAKVDPLGRHDVHSMFWLGFQNHAITAIYVVANIALGFHIAHGGTSLFQSLGLNNSKWWPMFKMVGPATGIFVGLGNVIMPLACALNIVKYHGV